MPLLPATVLGEIWQLPGLTSVNIEEYSIYASATQTAADLLATVRLVAAKSNGDLARKSHLDQKSVF